MNPNDPAAPEDGEIADGLTAAEATALANGAVGPGSTAMNSPSCGPQTAADRHRQGQGVPDHLHRQHAPRVTTASAPRPLRTPVSQAPPARRSFTKIDCSGFVRAAIRRSTLPELTAFPDGSVVQHDWTQAKGFPPGAVDDGELEDGRVRIAFLPPSAADSGIGHVVLIHQGQTLESHGGTGPDSRQWSTLPWRTSTKVFELTW